MKVALCLSGQPRVVEVGYQKLKASILDNNDVDVFIHTWFDPDNLSQNSVIPGRESHHLAPNALETLTQLYHPKAMLVEKPKSWKRSYGFPDKCFTSAWTWGPEVVGGLDVAKEYISNTTHCMFYSIMMSNLLKERYATEEDIHYDWVVRNRIDYSPHVGITFDVPPEDDTAFYYDHNPDHKDGMIGDWFGFGSNNAMNVYSGVFNNIGQLIRQSNNEVGYWCNELLLKHQLINNNINIVGGSYQVHY